MESKLEKFEKKLYKREEKKRKIRHPDEVYREEFPLRKKGWEEDQGVFIGAGRRWKIFTFLFVFVLGAVLVWGVYYYFARDPVFDKNKVGMSIIGPDSVTSGDEISFTVLYRNDTEIPLKDASVIFIWPKQSVLSGVVTGISKERADFGAILPHQEKNTSFFGTVYGAKGEDREVVAIFHYTPSGSDIVIEEVQKISLQIRATPFALTIRVPSQVVSEKEVEIELEYQNQSDNVFQDMRVRVVYPNGFRLISADPEPSEGDSIWNLENVEKRAAGIIVMRGVFSGAQGELKSLYAEVGSISGEETFISYATADSEVTIASSALLVFQTVNDSRDFTANSGGTLVYKIRYKNTTNFQIPNVVILAEIDPTFVDIKTLNVQWGSYDGRSNAIIWNTVGVPELATLDPKEEGQVSFSVNLNPAFLPKNFTEKNFTVLSKARITSSFAPEQLQGLPVESEDTLAVKINTQFAFYENAYYRDGVIKNVGSVPLRVGEKTTFAISWQLTNTTNNVDDVKVSAVMPPNVEWTGVINPPNENITYNPNSGLITWSPGKVFAGSGMFIPIRRVDFQVAFTPALVHVGKFVRLVSGAKLSGVDSFTGLVIERAVGAVSSDLLGVLKGEGKVRQ